MRAELAIERSPQVPIVTEHLIHGGMYSRTIRLEAGTAISGAMMQVPTILIINGAADVLGADGWYALNGYAVLPGSKGRKQIIIAREALEMTMIFPTQAQAVEDAEREFTADHEKLMSRKSVGDTVVVTGE